MNKEQTAKLIEVMQAYVDGKAIEERVHPNYTPADNWRETNFPTWNCEAYLYRVKKEPRVFWTVIYSDKSFNSFGSKEDAEYEMQNYTSSEELIKVQEIIE